MLKFVAGCAIWLLLATSASAQTAAQWSQLLSYVSQQTRLIIDLRARMERMEDSDARQRSAINATIVALDQERCRISRLINSVRDNIDSGAQITLIDGVACIDLKSPVPPFPDQLPP